MVTKLICVANSLRPSGRCLAGIDLETGELVRPLHPRQESIPEGLLYLDGEPLALGEIFSLKLRMPARPTRYQRENRLIAGWNWQRLGRVPLGSLLKFCDDTAPILHGSGDRVDPTVLETQPPDEWKSLQIVRPRRVEFVRDHRDRDRWRVRFRDQSGGRYFLRLTDPVAMRKLEARQSLSRELLFLVSLTKPWVPEREDKAACCYKIVAAVFELDKKRSMSIR